MIDHGRKPAKWAATLHTILAAYAGTDRFPIDVESLAVQYSKQLFPTDPIKAVRGEPIGDFEGALYPLESGAGWAIIVNSSVSRGRRRFTVAHEFGHYLMHRALMPRGFECDERSVTFRDGDAMEAEADMFAAYLLMPFDDCRQQIPPDHRPTLEDLATLAERYGVSLIAATLRWLEYTHCRSLLVTARDGYVLWSKSSQAALKTGRYFRTRGDAPPVPIPASAVTGRVDLRDIGKEGIDHPAGVWFDEDCTEYTILSDRYDQSITLLHLPKYAPSIFDFRRSI
ncbi:MAG: hypothetical protein C0519_04540 [Hyphomicrobium sp.]|nr:hypothetical protein [Hyphomicrobium sp.]